MATTWSGLQGDDNGRQKAAVKRTTAHSYPAEEPTPERTFTMKEISLRTAVAAAKLRGRAPHDRIPQKKTRIKKQKPKRRGCKLGSEGMKPTRSIFFRAAKERRTFVGSVLVSDKTISYATLASAFQGIPSTEAAGLSLQDRMVFRSAHFFYYSAFADYDCGMGDQGRVSEKDTEEEWQERALGFFKDGVLAAAKSSLLSSEDKQDRMTFWKSCYNANTLLFSRNLFLRAAKLDYRSIAEDPRWNEKLQHTIVEWYETIYANLYLQASKEKKLERSRWNKEVVYTCRAQWPKWRIGIGEIPFVA